MIPAPFPVSGHITTQCRKLLNTFPSCTVPSARQESSGDLASNRRCHRDLGHMPASTTLGNNPRSLGTISRGMIWFSFWLVLEKFSSLPLSYFTHTECEFALVCLAELCSKFGLWKHCLKQRCADAPSSCSFQVAALQAASTHPRTCREWATDVICLSLNNLQPLQQNHWQNTAEAVMFVQRILAANFWKCSVEA